MPVQMIESVSMRYWTGGRGECLSSGPLAWSAAFVGGMDFFFDLVAEVGVGVFVAGGHFGCTFWRGSIG